ncbi:MAG: class I SAM-dependent methyltransferase [Pseudonocardiaceae bacterium]
MTLDPGEFEDVTRAQQAMWSRGDFHRIGVSQVVVGELLVRDLHIHAGERVLDVAGGAGNTALAAARRWARVTCTDYVPELLERAEQRARAEGLPMQTHPADAQALPYPDGSFDVVTSTFGAMFAPDQQATASELMRVLRPGGRLGMANWTPESWVGAQFALAARYIPPPPGVLSPAGWGTVQRLEELFAGLVASLHTSGQTADFVHHSTNGLFELFRDWFGPAATVLTRLEPGQASAYIKDWVALADEHNVATDGTCEIPSPYLQVVALRKS